jgi:hypothetical protein
MAGRVTLHPAAIHQYLQGPGGEVHRLVGSVARKTEALAKANARVDTGRGRASGNHSVTNVGPLVVGRVAFSAKHMLYQHEGTGIYAGRPPIRPKKAKVLVFQVGGRTVYARQVRGIRGDKFLVKAFIVVSPWPVKVNT